MTHQATHQHDADPNAELREMQWATALLSRRDGVAIKHLIDAYLGVGDSAHSNTQQRQGERQLSELLSSSANWLLPHLSSKSPALPNPPFSSLLGLELEGLSEEDQEFEAARQFMRLASSALTQLRLHARTPNGARRAFFQAARLYAPGLLTIARSRTPSEPRRGFPVSGRWSRRGYTITLRP